jgi:hypothetical protein
MILFLCFVQQRPQIMVWAAIFYSETLHAHKLAYKGENMMHGIKEKNENHANVVNISIYPVI